MNDLDAAKLILVMGGCMLNDLDILFEGPAELSRRVSYFRIKNRVKLLERIAKARPDLCVGWQLNSSGLVSNYQIYTRRKV